MKKVLIVDDNVDIHRDLTRVLSPVDRETDHELDDLESRLFGNGSVSPRQPEVKVEYQIDSAYQGQEALQMMRQASAEQRPYAMIFMDVRMPPGWDGIETVEKIWAEFPYVETVICSAYSDYSWDDIVARLGATDRLLFLAKPFDPIEVKQLALTLTKKS